MIINKKYNSIKKGINTYLKTYALIPLITNNIR